MAENRTEKRYVRPTVGGWLRPTLIAPWISVYGAVTAAAALGIDKGLFGKVVGWALGMTLGTLWTFVFCLMLVLVDVSLLAVKVRTLPSGKRGWAAAFFSPFAVFGLYTLAPPYTFYKYGPWAVVGAVLVPMFVVAIVARVFAGQKTLR
jgi:hypothetical protein